MIALTFLESSYYKSKFYQLLPLDFVTWYTITVIKSITRLLNYNLLIQWKQLQAYEAANTLKNPSHKPSTSSFITYKMHRWFLKWKLISYNKRTLARPTTDERMNGDGEPATGNNTLSAFSASSLWDYDRTARQY